MNLQELHENKKTVIVKRALREHYDLDVNFDRLNLKQTQKMLRGVKSLIAEARAKRDIHESHKNSAYLKLIMMEQALSDHLSDLRLTQAKIVVENEEVLKSQVILAAQDMVDNLQKMLEQVSKMNVEELNAVVTGMNNEFGSDVSQQFNSAASQALTNLQQAITTTKDSLNSALNSVTGDAAPAPMPGADMGAAGMEEPSVEPSIEEPDMGDEEISTDEVETDTEIEEPDVSGAGRERR